MAVTIRLKRMGRLHRPFFRITAVDRRKKRDGDVIEELGHYDPIHKDPTKQLSINRERIQYWLGVGAQPSETVHSLLRREGLASGPYLDHTKRHPLKPKEKAVKKEKE